MDFIHHMRRSVISAGRAADNGNYLESGEVRSNMFTRWFVFVLPCGASASFIGEKIFFINVQSLPPSAQIQHPLFFFTNICR
mgnify:CR=1 FL=1